MVGLPDNSWPPVDSVLLNWAPSWNPLPFKTGLIILKSKVLETIHIGYPLFM